MWEQSVPRLVLASFVCGGLCGALWELFKIFRILFGISEYPQSKSKKGKGFAFWAVLFQDVSFFVLSACFTSVAFYYGNNGNFRIYALVVIAVGFWVYTKTLGALSVKLARCVRGLVCKFVGKLRRAVKRAVSFLRKKKLKIIKQKSKEAV